MRAIDKVRAAFVRNLRKLTVPEWGLDLYFGTLTVDQFEVAEMREPKKPFERNLFLLVAGARDADGKPAFVSEDIHFLRTEADLAVVSRVIAFQWQGVPDTDGAEQELKNVPGSASA